MKVVISEANLSRVCPDREASRNIKAQGCSATEGTPCLVFQGPANWSCRDSGVVPALGFGMRFGHTGGGEVQGKISVVVR